MTVMIRQLLAAAIGHCLFLKAESPVLNTTTVYAQQK